MFNSETLELGIGMTFLFLMMSLICTGIKEWIEGILKWRAMDLERAVRTLLDDKNGELSSYLFSHPLISSLYQGRYDPSKLTASEANRKVGGDAASMHMPLGARRNLPSYIPSELFAKALVDIVVRGPAQVAGENIESRALTIEQLRERAVALASPFLGRLMLTAIDHSGGDLKEMTANLQNWFDGSMDRASGWYKRRTQSVLFVLGLLAAVILNVDTIHVMERLTSDKALREAIVTAAARAAEAESTSVASTNGLLTAEKVRAELNAIGMPMGWQIDDASPIGRSPVQICPNGEANKCPDRALYPALQIALGWLITAFAVMLGAPFWFDVLNKFMVIRSTVKPHEKSPEESSEDRKDKSRETVAIREGESKAPTTNASASISPVKPVVPNSVSQTSTHFTPHQWQDGTVNPMEIPL